MDESLVAASVRTGWLQTLSPLRRRIVSVATIGAIFAVLALIYTRNVIDFRGATIRWAPAIALTFFVVGAFCTFVAEFGWKISEKAWLAVDSLWVFTSVTSFVISALYISSDGNRVEAARWSLNVRDRQELTIAEIESFRGQYCVDTGFPHPANDKAACDASSRLEYELQNSIKIASSTDFNRDIPTAMDISQIKLESRHPASIQWRRIQILMGQCRNNIEKANENRIRAENVEYSSWIRCSWFWIYPCVAGVRLMRPWRRFIEKKMNVSVMA